MVLGGCLPVRLAGWLAGLLAGWLAGLLAGWLALDLSIDRSAEDKNTCSAFEHTSVLFTPFSSSRTVSYAEICMCIYVYVHVCVRIYFCALV